MKIFTKNNFSWLAIAFISVFCVVLAHFVFQHWLYMMPCERCVYIRYAFFVVFLGAILGVILPKILKLIACVLIVYGVIYGIFVAFELNGIKNSIESGDVFGVSGCKMLPNFHFNLPLDMWWADMFAPKALCGFDAPQLPFDANISALQGYFIELYKGGWYLLPKYEFLNLAQCSIIAFGVILVILVYEVLRMRFWR